MYSVSSAFIAAVSSSTPTMRRVLTIGGSDYSSEVIKWPAVSRKWDELKPGTVTLDLSNTTGTFNFLVQNPLALRASVEVKLGALVATNSYEDITLFSGRGDVARLSQGKVALTVVDKFKQLAERTIGTQNTPQSYTGSAYFVHDLAWYICTSHGGLSAIQSTSNPDIDYASWTSWSAIFSSDNVRTSAQFTGQKPTEALRDLSRLTQSTIWINNGRVAFARFSVADSASLTLNNSVLVSDTLMDERLVQNRSIVYADYDVASRYHKITVVAANSSSVNSYGERAEITEAKNIWYTSSVSALNLAQRVLSTYAQLFPRHDVTGVLDTLHLTIGDVLTFVDSSMLINESYRIMEETIDMERATHRMVMDRSQYATAFRLDFSALDGTDQLL